MRKPNLFSGKRKIPQKKARGPDATPRTIFEGESWHDYSLPAIAAKSLVSGARGLGEKAKRGIAARRARKRAKNSR